MVIEYKKSIANIVDIIIQIKLFWGLIGEKFGFYSVCNKKPIKNFLSRIDFE